MTQFLNSPGVYTTEVDLSATTPAVATAAGGIAGVFRWGPVDQLVLVDSESTLVNRFQKPSNLNAETFFTAASFLSYSNRLYVVRTANTTGNTANVTNTTLSAIVSTNATPSNTILLSSIVKNADDFTSKTFDSTVMYVAKYPGALGNSLKVSVCDSAAAFSSNIALSPNSTINATATQIAFTIGSNSATISISPSATGDSNNVNDAADTVIESLSVGDIIRVGNNSIGEQLIKVTAIGAAVDNGANVSISISLANPYTLATAYTANTIERRWEYSTAVNKAPGRSVSQAASNNAINDEMHVVVVDEDGLFTGVPNTILEVFEGLSRATDAKNETNQSIYYKNVINNTSSYVWVGSDRAGAATGLASVITSSVNTKPLTQSFASGTDGQSESDVSLGIVASGYDFFRSTDIVDVSILMQGIAKSGVSGTGLANYIISNVIGERYDTILTISPEKADVVNANNNELDNILEFRNALNSTSYAVLDSGYKYTYDKYNDVFRWVPLNGDIAGLIARTSDISDDWMSPAGYNRGRIKNVVKLAYNPRQAHRDILYKADVNPVISPQNQGPMLFGDKTLLGKPSAFSRIGPRRLFIMLRKMISAAADTLLFEINDEFTRAQFISIVDPTLRNIEGRRGITTYRIICDETNNTPDIIDNNGFVGSILVAPGRSINSILLNFVATGSDVRFEEVTISNNNF